MTAEIVIINQHGVAMAADSAVTIGNQKIINSAIKLFSLSRTEPVGIMIYGNANLLNIPWETLIKLYRKDHNNALDKLQDYSDGFIEFIKSKMHLFNPQLQDDWAECRIYEIYNIIIENLKNEITSLQEKGGIIDENVICNHAESLVIEYSAILNNNEQIYKSEITSEIEARIFRIADKLIENIFPFVAKRQSIKDSLRNIAKLALLNCAPINSSGIVIAGFGNDDIFPSVITYEIYGIFNNYFLYRIIEDKTIINENSNYMRSDIIPFAQEDVVRSFLDGIHPELFEYTIDYTSKALQTIFDSHLVTLNTDASILAEEISENLRNEILQFTSSKLLSPMIDMIKVLPKDELASMAEALVNMTAFRRKMAFSSMETVGGPVDVAMISKGDGMVWVKRKHYFPKELNSHFFENYFK